MKKEQTEVARVTRTRAQVRATYDRISRWYDPLEGYWEGKPKQTGLEKLCVQPGEVVLEIGCGTGHGIAALLQSTGPSGKVYGLDLSPKMLAITQKRIGRQERRFLAEQGDALYLPFATACIDAIFASFALELFDSLEIPEVLAECRRVCKRGGRICIVSLSKASGSNWMTRLYEWGHYRFPQILDCRPIYVERALQEAGLETVEATHMSLWGLSVEIVVARKSGFGRKSGLCRKSD